MPNQPYVIGFRLVFVFVVIGLVGF